MGLIGFAQNMHGELDKAEAAFRDQREIAVRLGDEAQIASTGILLGEALRRRGHFTAALTEVVKSRDLYDQLGIAQSVAYAKRDEAAVLAMLGRARA